jgi:protein-disulfide isomerase
MSRNQIYILVGGCLLALCGVGALAVGIYFLAPTLADQLNPIPEVVSIVPEPYSNVNGNSMGDPDAPIKMEEFSDFQCPYCQHFHDATENLLMEEYISTGKVYFTYRSMGNFVSDNLARSMGTSANTESQDAALAAYCAGDQNKFWEMQTYLFANVLGENVGSFTDRRIHVIAEKVGLDMDQFSDCYGSEKYAKDIQQDFADGQAAGIMGVPSFLLTYTVDGVTINRLIEGAQPFSNFQQELESILDEIGAQ